MFNIRIGKFAIWFLSIIHIQVSGSTVLRTVDLQTSSNNPGDWIIINFMALWVNGSTLDLSLCLLEDTNKEKFNQTTDPLVLYPPTPPCPSIGGEFIHEIYRSQNWHVFRDQTSPRTNTLFDDADDIQRQLDNEARDRIKCGKPRIHWPDITEIPSIALTLKTPKTVQPFLWGRMLKMFPDAVGNRIIEVSPKTIWVFHFPTHYPTKLPVMDLDYVAKPSREVWPELDSQMDFYSPDSPYQYQWTWDYISQNTWSKNFPNCKGQSQSPVNLPVRGLLKTKGARPLYFKFHNEKPKAMMLQSDGQRAILYGVWPRYRRPLIYGGAVHSRRYIFHSFTVHWPSEHRVAGQVYPVETQALFISAEYKTMEDALNGYPRDLQAILGISNLYKYGNHTHQGLAKMMNFSNDEQGNIRNFTAKPLAFFNPPFNKYVCYQGSLTVPPCTETVIWFIRARALSVRRDFIDAIEAVMGSDSIPRRGFVRMPQPLNDRKVFIFT